MVFLHRRDVNWKLRICKETQAYSISTIKFIIDKHWKKRLLGTVMISLRFVNRPIFTANTEESRRPHPRQYILSRAIAKAKRVANLFRRPDANKVRQGLPPKSELGFEKPLRLPQSIVSSLCNGGLDPDPAEADIPLVTINVSSYFLLLWNVKTQIQREAQCSVLNCWIFQNKHLWRDALWEDSVLHSDFMPAMRRQWSINIKNEQRMGCIIGRPIIGRNNLQIQLCQKCGYEKV